MHAVTVLNQRLTFAREGVVPISPFASAFIEIAESCLSHDPANRPAIKLVAAQLANLRGLYAA